MTSATTGKGLRPESPSRSFGEEGGRLSYGSYLHLDELLSAQRLLSDPPAHDELLFITVHQVYELWFKQLLFELATLRDLMPAGDVARSRHILERVHAIQRVLIEQISVLEAMAPQDFLEFRKLLAPASGFQSVQFRAIEFLSGLKDPAYLERLETSTGELNRLERHLSEATLWDSFCTLLTDRGLPMPADDAETRLAGLVAMANDRVRWEEEFALSEALLTYDELWALWRQRHVLMVERQIGSKSGTGGSSGADYLRSTLGKRFFPELWELRSHL